MVIFRQIGVIFRLTPYNGLYREAPPEKGTFFRLHAYKRVGISQVEVAFWLTGVLFTARHNNENYYTL